jgi:DNA polymerase III subunit delta
VKVSRPVIEKAFDKGGEGTRVFLLYGPDEAGSRSFLPRLARALGQDAERVDLTAAMLKDDPALLAGEAASTSLFGSKSYIVIDISGRDDLVAAIDILLANERATNPVVIFAGALKESSPLVKRLATDPAALCMVSHIPSDRDLGEIAVALAREQGLRLDRDAAAGLTRQCGGDRAVLAREVEKLALYLDADPATPQEASIADVDAIGADNGETQLSDLNLAVFAGRVAQVAVQLPGLASEGLEGIPLARTLSKRAMLLARVKSELDAGKPQQAVVASIFWKEREAVAAAARKWTHQRIARAADRLLEVEREMKRSKSAGSILADTEIMTIARAAAGK